MGVQAGTRYFEQLRAAGVSDIATYDGLGEMVRDLSHGRIDAGFGDKPIIDYQLRVGPKRHVRLAPEFKAPFREDLCLVLRKGDPLLPAINRAIDHKAAAFAAIRAHWHL